MFLCPRYEGVDERVRAMVDLELSIGDYVLTGGELPALVVIDAVIRLLPGAIDEASTVEESLRRGPARVPAVHPARHVRGQRGAGGPDLGDHAAVRRWREREALRRTLERRPDLIAEREPTRDGAAHPRRAGCRAGRRRLSHGLGGPRRPRTPCYTPAGRRQAPRCSTRLEKRSTLRRRPRRDRRVNVLDEIVSDQLRTDLPVLASGDTVRVSAKVVEGTRERIQVFEGILMRLRGGGIARSITVRRIASGVGVERTFKVNSPRIEKIEVIRHGQVRRAQLYFLRERVGKAATLRERRPKAVAAGAKAPKGSKAAKAPKATAAKAAAAEATATTPAAKA